MSKWKKIRSKVGFALGIVMLLTALAFVEQENASNVCEALNVRVEGVDGAHFISEQTIRQELIDRGSSVMGAKLRDLDLVDLEDQLQNIPSVKDANVFHTMDGTLHAHVEQRRPIVRMIDANGGGFYVDSDGWCMPLSDDYTPSLFIVKSMKSEPFVGQGVMHVQQNDSLKEISFADEAFEIATVIQADEFWTRMFDHALVAQDGVFHLVPRIGGHRIIIDEADKLSLQLNKLRAFYENGIDQVGWRAYSKIDLRFADQIVCTKK